MRVGLWVFGACVAALLAACGGSASDAAARAGDSASPAISPGDTTAGSGPRAIGAGRPMVLFVGTSLTAGYGLDDPASEAYPAVLQRMADSAKLDVEMVNAGLSGETSASAVRRVAWLLDRYGARTRIVVVETGANDGLRALDPDTMRANIDSLVATVQHRLPDAEILLVQMEAPPNLGPDYTRRFGAVFPAVARARGVTLLPFLLDGVAGVARMNQGDGIHPTVQGATIAARNIWPGVREAIEGVIAPSRP